MALPAEHAVGEHRLADVHTAVVDQVDLAQTGPRGGEHPRETFPDGVIAQVPEVQGLVRVRAGELEHDTGLPELRAAPVRRALLGDIGEDSCDDGRRGKLHVHVGPGRGRGARGKRLGVARDAAGELLGDERRRFFQHPRVGKHGKCEIAQLGLWRGLHDDRDGIDARRIGARRELPQGLRDDGAPLLSVFLHSVTGI